MQQRRRIDGTDATHLRGCDGQRLAAEVTAAPLVDGGQVAGAIVVFRDVTDRRAVERMKDEFLSVVSHELRTPLTPIRGALGLLAGGMLGPISEPASGCLTQP